MYTVTIYQDIVRAQSFDFDDEREARSFCRKQSSSLTKGVLFLVDNIHHTLVGMVDKF